MVAYSTVTFERRQTAIPQGLPIGLSDEFINDAQKEKQWQAFLRKNALDPMPLAVVIADLAYKNLTNPH